MTQLLNISRTGLLSTVFKANALLQNASVLNNPAASYASYRKVYADLGIPEPPKKPANAYVRFLTDKLDGLSLNIAQRKEKFKEGGLLWKKLDQNTRDQYLNNFSSEQAKYKAAKVAWEAKISPSQKEQLKQAIDNIRAVKVKRAEKRKTIDDRIRLGKPIKHNASSFLIFYKKIHREQPTNFKEASALWKQLPEAEKKKYDEQSREARLKYELALATWEKKMLQNGRADLVRKNTIDAQKKAHKTTNTEPKH